MNINRSDKIESFQTKEKIKICRTNIADVEYMDV